MRHFRPLQSQGPHTKKWRKKDEVSSDAPDVGGSYIPVNAIKTNKNAC
jgi:hypothetical protein